MTNKFYFFCVLFCFQFGAFAGEWATDAASGCKVWNPFPGPGETVEWKGLCRNGYANGKGVLTWFANGKRSSRTEGELRDGKTVGKQVVEYANGDRWEGEFLNDKRNGYSVYTWANGQRYEGEYRDSKRNGFGVLTIPREVYLAGTPSDMAELDGEVYVARGLFANNLITLKCQSKAACEKLARDRDEEERKYFGLGRCQIGDTVVHREKIGVTSSSGNVLADMIWSSHTKAKYIIEYEAVVEAIVGTKVKTIINGYSVKQLSKGSYVNASDAQENVAKTADKLVGKIQFYDRSRCSN